MDTTRNYANSVTAKDGVSTIVSAQNVNNVTEAQFVNTNAKSPYVNNATVVEFANTTASGPNVQNVAMDCSFALPMVVSTGHSERTPSARPVSLLPTENHAAAKYEWRHS